MSNRKRFLVVGGLPFRSYTGTGSFTGLRLVGATDSEDEVQALVDVHYDDCGGLIHVFDLDNLSGEFFDDASESPKGEELGLIGVIQDESEVDDSERDTLTNIPAVLSYPVPPV